MSNEKVIKLATEFAKKLGESSRDKQFQEQRERLEEFYFDITGKMRALINEMDSDAFVLRQRGLDKHSMKLFSQITQTMIALMKKIKADKPYPGVESFIQWAESEETQALIEDLDFLIQMHMKRTEIDFAPHKAMRQAEVRSLNKISWLAHEAKQYIAKHPLLQEYHSAPPAVNREELVQGPEAKLGPLAETIPPPKLKR
ncbi:MAG: hypothetical protein AB7I18_14760 [Candidatus Berkiella sp.]